MILVEGPDNSGKSTLVRQLIKEFDLLECSRPHGPPKTPTELLSRATSILLKQDDKKYITDRHPLFGEDIYGPILRNRNMWTEIQEEYDRLKNMLLTSSTEGLTYIIYCRPPDEVVLNLNTHEVKDYDTPQHLKALYHNADKVLKAYDEKIEPLADFTYNYKDKYSYDLLITQLRKEYFKNECK